MQWSHAALQFCNRCFITSATGWSDLLASLIFWDLYISIIFPFSRNPCLQVVLHTLCALTVQRESFNPSPFTLWEFFVSCSVWNCCCFKLRHFPPAFKNGWWSTLPLRQRWRSLTKCHVSKCSCHHFFSFKKKKEERREEFLNTLWSLLSSRSWSDPPRPVCMSWADNNETNAVIKIITGTFFNHCISLRGDKVEILIYDKEKLLYFEKKGGKID